MSRQFRQAILCLLVLLPLRLFAYEVPFASEAPVIDGDPSDLAWNNASWVNVDHLVVGTMPEKDDFEGRYKLVWTKDHLYMLAEITDDILLDSHADPLELYWEDDTLEIFIDEDASGGNHQSDYNAFAYHIALDNQVADIGPFLSEEDRETGKTNRRLYPEHVEAKWKRSTEHPNRIYWEVKLSVYGDDYQDSYADGQKAAMPVKLETGKSIGFMVSYCDSDSTAGREHFMGDVLIEPVDGDRNRGYIDAGVFGTIQLVE